MRPLKLSLRAAILALYSLASSAASTTLPAPPAGAEAREARLLAKLDPQARGWIKQEAQREARSNAVSHTTASQAVASAGPGFNLAGMSVEDAVMLLMMEIARDAERDAKQMLADMERTRASKQA